MMPNSLTDAKYVDLSVPTAANPQVPPVIKLPDARSLSHARKMAKTLFGPLARVWVREHETDGLKSATTYEVGVERGGNRKVFAIGEKLQETLQAAVEHVSEYEHRHGKLPKNVMPEFTSAALQKPVLTRKMKWLCEYVDARADAQKCELLPGMTLRVLPKEDAEEIKTLVSHLRPNDVGDFMPPAIDVSSAESVKSLIESLRIAVS